MNINEKVEQLLQITMSIKNDLNEINSNDLNEKLGDLEWEKESLKNEIIDLRHSLTQQNELILSLVRIQNKKLVETIDANKLAPNLLFRQKVSKHTKLFPVESLDALDKLEAFINDENLHELVTVVQQILTPQGVAKNFASVLSAKCCADCNVYGINNKRRLLDYTKFMDLLFRAAYYEGYSQKIFLDEIRCGLRAIKRRNHNITFRNRQLQRQEEEYCMDDYLEEYPMESTDDLTILPKEFIKRGRKCM